MMKSHSSKLRVATASLIKSKGRIRDLVKGKLIAWKEVRIK